MCNLFLNFESTLDICKARYHHILISLVTLVNVSEKGLKGPFAHYSVAREWVGSASMGKQNDIVKYVTKTLFLDRL